MCSNNDIATLQMACLEFMPIHHSLPDGPANRHACYRHHLQRQFHSPHYDALSPRFGGFWIQEQHTCPKQHYRAEHPTNMTRQVQGNHVFMQVLECFQFTQFLAMNINLRFTTSLLSLPARHLRPRTIRSDGHRESVGLHTLQFPQNGTSSSDCA